MAQIHDLQNNPFDAILFHKDSISIMVVVFVLIFAPCRISCLDYWENRLRLLVLPRIQMVYYVKQKIPNECYVIFFFCIAVIVIIRQQSRREHPLDHFASQLVHRSVILSNFHLLGCAPTIHAVVLVCRYNNITIYVVRSF